MDIEYQFDPSVDNIYHQLATTPATIPVIVRQPISTSALGRPAITGAIDTRDPTRGLGISWGNHSTPPTSWVIPQIPTSTPASVLVSRPSQTSFDLQATLNNIQETLQHHQVNTQPAPPVVVINNLPPPVSGGWEVEPDHVAIGGAVATLLLIILCGFLWWLRKYRPNAWETVRTTTIRVLRFLALPASWLCGKAAGLLRSFHHDTQVGDFYFSSLQNFLFYSFIFT
jgi:hypothetical protein